MSWNDNVYYNPEKWGLTPVGDMEWSPSCYDFDLTAVWKDESGNLYWASDAGCSCPSPFEDYNSLDELECGTKYDLVAYLNDRLKDTSYEQDYANQQVVKLIEEVFAKS